MERSRFDGDNLRLLRNFFGLTLDELGSEIGTSRQYVSHLEQGKRQPSHELLGAICDVLGANEDYFFQQQFDDQIGLYNYHFRRLKKTKVATVNQVLAHGLFFRKLLEFFESKLKFPTVNFPSIKATTREGAERAAQSCRLQWGLTQDQPIANVARVLEANGAVITRFKGLNGDIDALSIDWHRPLIVRSSFKDSVTRFRWDLAHEMGHAVMHGGLETGDDESEELANYFAGAFLLPRRSFIRHFPIRRGRVDYKSLFALKKDWKVSAQAMVRRALELELINRAQYRSASIYFSKRGFRNREPFEPKHEERGEVLGLAIVELERRYGLSVQDISDHFLVKPRVILKLCGIDDSPQESLTTDTRGNVVPFPSKTSLADLFEDVG